jgi:hypothetical protein
MIGVHDKVANTLPSMTGNGTISKPALTSTRRIACTKWGDEFKQLDVEPHYRPYPMLGVMRNQ